MVSRRAVIVDEEDPFLPDVVEDATSKAQNRFDVRFFSTWQAAFNAAGVAGGTVFIPPGTYTVAEDILYTSNVGQLIVIAEGAQINYTGTGTLLTIATGAGATTRGPRIYGGKWLTTTGAYGIRIRDSQRVALHDLQVDGFSEADVELRNEAAWTEQTLINGCVLTGTGKQAIRFTPQSVSGGVGGTESFARTKVVNTICANGQAGEARILCRGNVYDSLLMGIGGNILAGAHVIHLEGSMGGTYIDQFGFEGGDATSRGVHTAGGSFAVGNKPTIGSAMHFLSPIVFTDAASRADLSNPIDTNGDLRSFGNLLAGASPSASGLVRLASNGAIRARNNANSADLEIARMTTADVLAIGGFASPVRVQVVPELEIDGALNHDGTTVGLYGVTPVVRNTGWTTPTNLTTDKTYDANATTVDELADVLGTLIEALKATGIIGA